MLKTYTGSGYFTLFVGEDNQYYFNLKAGNHEIILQSEGYTSKQGALNGIKSVQKNCTDKSHFEIREAVNGKPYFVLKAANGEIIGKGEEYNSKQALENGIESVCKNGQTNDIKGDGVGLDTEFRLFVNAKEQLWSQKSISFQELIKLAFGSFSNNDRTCYTVTYSRGIDSKPQGSLVFDQKVNVKSKMIFNVTATDKS